MSARSWVVYYTLNAVAPRDIDWWLGPDLPADEAAAVAASLQEFQVGESSSGNRLRAAAAAWVARHGDRPYLRALDLFIAEEQRHAAELARFLTLNGHPIRRRTAGDAVFRILRHLTGTLEMQLMVLRTAEVIGFVYYGTLRAGTRSLVLRSLCDTFLRDESAHLLFHAERLALIRSRRSRGGMLLTRALTNTLLMGTAGIVWARHGRALRPSGCRLGGFAASCLRVAASELEVDKRQVIHGHQAHRQSEAG